MMGSFQNHFGDHVSAGHEASATKPQYYQSSIHAPCHWRHLNQENLKDIDVIWMVWITLIVRPKPDCTASMWKACSRGCCKSPLVKSPCNNVALAIFHPALCRAQLAHTGRGCCVLPSHTGPGAKSRSGQKGRNGCSKPALSVSSCYVHICCQTFNDDVWELRMGELAGKVLLYWDYRRKQVINIEHLANCFEEYAQPLRWSRKFETLLEHSTVPQLSPVFCFCWIYESMILQFHEFGQTLKTSTKSHFRASYQGADSSPSITPHRSRFSSCQEQPTSMETRLQHAVLLCRMAECAQALPGNSTYMLPFLITRKGTWHQSQDSPVGLQIHKD